MGLAASQAKLLSITSRLSDNELRSQSITAAKLALANQTSEASRKYINALNKTEYIYRTYDQAGDKAYVALTGAQLSTYSPLKNQYALVNLDGQVLVSELDGANYENSGNINEFLDKYGIERIPTGETRTVVNPAYSDAYNKWLEEYNEWSATLPRKEDFTSEVPDTNNEIYIAVTRSGGCFSLGLSGLNCYMHVLSDLIGVGEHTTSSGQTFNVYDNIGWNWNSALHDKSVFDPIRPMLKNGHCSGDVLENTTTGSDGYEYTTEPVTGIPKLVGGPVSDPNMSLYQRAVDLLWEVHFDYNGSATGGNANAENLAKFFYFVEHDLKQATTKTVFDEDAYNEAVDEHGPAPVMEDIPATIDEEIYKYSDEDQAQWYVNLWHRMNGASSEKDGMQTTTTTTNVTSTEYGTTSPYTSTTVTTTKTGPRWKVLEDGLMNSQDWLKYALESGAVSLERVNYTNPTEEGTGLKDATWTSIIYTNALDISEQTDEKAIARAEAEYEQKSREIENKDKQYDSMLKLLDTEHSALQQEYESAKAVITKNTERTLKMYSA